MNSDVALRIEVHRGSSVSVLEVQDDRALVGSGAHCDLRLAPDEAAVEQLLIEAIGGDEVYARTRCVEPMCLLNGAPFLEGRLSQASLLELGGVALCVQRIQRQDQAARAHKTRQSATSPTIQVLGLVAVALGLYRVLSHHPSAVNALSDEAAPPPSAAVVEEPCPVTKRDGAAALARQLWLEAESKRERSPFYPGDGALGAGLFARAASCFTLAGDAAATQRARDAARGLSEQAADAIHVGHVRLERFLATDQLGDARRQAELLGELVQNKSSGYSQWLAGVVRECELRSNQVKR